MKRFNIFFLTVVLSMMPLFYAFTNPVGTNTPGTFADAISHRSVAVSFEEVGSVGDRERIVIDSSIGTLRTNDDFVLSISNQEIKTFDDLLNTAFVAVPCERTSEFRLDSEKHTIYSMTLEQATGNIVLNNTWGLGRNSNSSFVCFSYANGTLTAKSLFQFDTGSQNYVQGTGLRESIVGVNQVKKTLSISSGSENLRIATTDFPFDIPKDLNPKATAYVSNDRVSWGTSGVVKGGVKTLENTTLMKDLARNINSDYRSQVAAVGLNSSTTAAAKEMLQQIETNLAKEGAQLRYSPEVYLAFRESALSRTLETASVVNGEIGQNTVPYVFFTNEADNSGVHHPFMVIASFSVHDVPFRLLDVPRPPGCGCGPGRYDSQDVTRDTLLGAYQVKIPLRDYGEVTRVGANDMLSEGNTLANDSSRKPSNNVWNYASNSAVGIAIDGALIYPVLNNTLSPAAEMAELTNTGTHVGRGLELHWHADGHGATGNGLNLYNLPDYVGHDHPPLIGFGLDGVALYGKYESSYPRMDGVKSELDLFGGHEHDNYDYHYHAHPVESSELGSRNKYTIHVLLRGAWAGKIGSIPDFWDKKNVATKGKSIYTGDVGGRPR